MASERSLNRGPPSERTLMKKRSCKHCGRNIYLQSLSVSVSKPQWVIFDLDGKLHSCPVSPLEPETKQRILNAIDQMNPSSYSISSSLKEILPRIDLVIQELKGHTPTFVT